MSTPYDPTIITRRTDANMLTQEWRLVNAVGDNDMDLAGLGTVAIGALTNDVATGAVAAVFLPVQVGGMIKAVCGGAIPAGSLAMPDAAGAAIVCTPALGGATASQAFGIALETHAAGDVGTFLFAPSYVRTA